VCKLKVLLHGCRCVEIDVWDGESKSRSEEAEGTFGDREKKHGIRDKLSSHGPFKHFRKKSDSNTFIPSTETDSLSLPTPWVSPSTATRAEPRVLHGYTLTKEVPFRDVCTAIRDAAFVNRCDGFHKRACSC